MTTTKEETKDLSLETSKETDSIEAENPGVVERPALSAEEVLLLQEMAEAGLLYGLAKSKTHPEMKSRIFATRSGTEIINLENTIKELERAAAFLKSISSSGKKIIIVGTSPAAKFAAKEFGTKLDLPYVAERWLGGTLTNFKAIEGRIKYYNKLLSDKESGALQKYTKKERVLLDKKIEKMRLLFEGLTKMTGLPGAVLVLDVQSNKTAIREAHVTNIPVVAIINTDTDPKIADYPVSANNRLGESVKWIMNYLEDSLKNVIQVNTVPEKGEKE
ncbi:MAG: 30S ribosomal protein S2 [Parcubacteria group bacterium]